MKAKTKKFLTVAFSCLAAVFLSSSLITIDAVQAETTQQDVSTQTATFVSSTTLYGKDWQSSGFGKNGYVIFGGTSNTIYSNMYTESGDEYGITDKITTSGWAITGSSYITVNGKHVDAASSLELGIDKWTVTGRAWKNGAHADSALYTPGTTSTEQGAIYGWGSTTFLDEVSIIINKTSSSALFLTVYCSGENPALITTELPYDVYVFSGAQMTKPSNYKTRDAMKEFYGGSEKVLMDQTEITSGPAYVTVKLEGTGEFQFVYSQNTNDDGSLNKAAKNPQIYGFFLDNAMEEITAEYEQTVKAGPDWESTGLGKNGYVVFGSDANTVYSNLYTQNGSGYTETDVISLSGWTNNTSNTFTTYSTGNYINPSESLGVSIDKWAVTRRAWREDQNGLYGSLYAPGTTEHLSPRLDGMGNNSAFEDTSIIINKTSSGAVYFTTYLYGSSGKEISESNPIDFYVFQRKDSAMFYHSKTSSTDALAQYSDMTKLVDKVSITKNMVYVTFRLEGTGLFQIVAAKGTDETGAILSGNATPYLGAFFLDNELPSIEVETAPAAVSLNLDGTIGVNFYMNLPEINSTTTLKFTYADGKTEVKTPSAFETNGSYKFTARVAAKDYDSTIKAQVFNGEEAVSEVFPYSVKEYCDRVTANSTSYSEELVALCESLVRYCTLADAYFDDTVDASSVDMSVTATMLEGFKMTVSGTIPEGVTMLGSTLTLESSTELRIYFALEDGLSVSDLTITVGGEPAVVETSGDNYCIVIGNISAKDLDTTYTVAIGDYNVNICALSYVYQALCLEDTNYVSNELALTVRALYLYNQAANVYFGE